MPYDEHDVALMHLALDEAERGARGGEVPVGAIIEYDGKVIARAHNQPIGLNDPTAHAEILAIRAAAQSLGSYRLGGAALYVTLEPCPMCMGAIIQARLARVKFGVRDPKAGAAGSVYDFGRDGWLNHWVEIYPELMASECAQILARFFAARRC
ncbi:MAG TPA: tRNA adenosine(34) deaminase TadA [Candidatus Binataceae bacterium]|nr:tRNA adenosine(34) deaminase TadA [Candidatus Binataceae bacterium]